MVGDPLDPETDVGPLISPGDRDRVKEWVDEAVAPGAELLTGGELVDEGRCLAPTLLGAPPKECQGLVRGDLRPGGDDRHLLRLRRGAARWRTTPSSASRPASSPATSAAASKAGETLEFGGVLINEVPTFRADQMPYGGVKDSGNTREGPAYAVLRADRGALRHPPGLALQQAASAHSRFGIRA